MQDAPQGSVPAAAKERPRPSLPRESEVQRGKRRWLAGSPRAGSRDRTAQAQTDLRQRALQGEGRGGRLAPGPRPPATPRGDEAPGRPPGGSPKRLRPPPAAGVPRGPCPLRRSCARLPCGPSR